MRYLYTEASVVDVELYLKCLISDPPDFPESQNSYPNLSINHRAAAPKTSSCKLQFQIFHCTQKYVYTRETKSNKYHKHYTQILHHIKCYIRSFKINPNPIPFSYLPFNERAILNGFLTFSIENAKLLICWTPVPINET